MPKQDAPNLDPKAPVYTSGSTNPTTPVNAVAAPATTGALTDAEVADLGTKGYKEGSIVPVGVSPKGSGVLLPDGTFGGTTGTSMTDNTPISSASASQTNNINSATSNAVTTTPEPLSDSQKWYMQKAGLSEADVRTLSDSPEKRAAIGSGYQQDQANQQELAANQTKEAADFQNVKQQIDTHRQGALEQAKAAANAANPYAATAGGADNGADAINNLWDKAETQATSQHEAAMAALTAGNTKAGAALLT